MKSTGSLAARVALFAVAAVALGSCEGEPSRAGGGREPLLEVVLDWQRGRTHSAVQGEVLYRRHCAVCHGESGDGGGFNASMLDPKPADLVSVAEEADTERILQVIAEGSGAVGLSTLCPPWGRLLSPPERRAVADYVVFLAGPPPGEPSAP